MIVCLIIGSSVSYLVITRSCSICLSDRVSVNSKVCYTARMGGLLMLMMETVNFTVIHSLNCRALLNICQRMSVSCPVFILFLNISLSVADSVGDTSINDRIAWGFSLEWYKG